MTTADMMVDGCGVRILVRPPVATMPVATGAQGASVAYAADGSAYFTTSEGADPTPSRVAE